MDAFVGRFVGAPVGVLEGLKTGTSTLVGAVVGALVGHLVGHLVGPLVGPLVVPLVGRGSLSPALCVADLGPLRAHFIWPWRGWRCQERTNAVIANLVFPLSRSLE